MVLAKYRAGPDPGSEAGGVFIVRNHPRAIDAGPELAPKPPLLRSVEPSRSARSYVDLNFKVSEEFRSRFKRVAVDADLKNVQLLRRALAAYEREQRSAS